jgi:hypothetical protein
MFRTLSPNFYKSFYSTIPEFNSYINYKNNIFECGFGGGGGNDPKIFYLFLLGITIYSINKVKK